MITLATVPDHIVPLSKDGADTDDNIRCLCHDCHRIRTEEQLGYRHKNAIGVDGWPIEDQGGIEVFGSNPFGNRGPPKKLQN